jgi:glyoxylase-like metal-dependent hydrolase (beta-lactamase superfamily II)
MRIRALSLLAGLQLVACAGAPAPYVLQPGHIDLERGPDGNTVILDAPQGLIVVDSGRHPEHAEAILEHARRVDAPIVAIVNTHWHLDHTTGNLDLLAAHPRAQVVASRAVEGALAGFLADSRAGERERLADPTLSPEARARSQRALHLLEHDEVLVPTHAIEREGPVELGGRTLEVRLAPRAATAGDVWLLVPDEQLAIVGDLVVAPVPFFDTACEQGWTAALEAIADERGWTRLVPGHGAPMDRPAFLRWKSAFERLLACARSSADADECAGAWLDDAAGFYTPAERDSVARMARYYVAEVMRAPADARMPYCRE